MFKLFIERYVNPQNLHTSKLYNDQGFYAAFTADLNRAKRDVTIESPYLTCKLTNQLLPIFHKLRKKGVNVRMIKNRSQTNFKDSLL